MVVAIMEVDMYGMYCGLVPRAPELLHQCQGPCFACVPSSWLPNSPQFNADPHGFEKSEQALTLLGVVKEFLQ